MKKIILGALLINLFFLNSCKVKEYTSNAKPITHELWTSLLNKHVSTDGHVNYEGFIEDKVTFDKYLTLLQNNHPNKKQWSDNEQLAYWINAYNAFTVKLIVDNYPLESIKDIKRGLVFVNTVWDMKFIQIEKATYDLNNIEHGIIRKQFDEPRIHFAVNCASVSCPNLRNEAFVADRLDEQLTEQSKYFLRNNLKNNITADRIKISKIFNWFKGDFTKNGSLIDFLNLYAPSKINSNATIEYMDYDWGLNKSYN